MKYDPDRKESDKHPQPEAPQGVSERGVQALKDIKEIKKTEEQQVKKDQEVVEQADDQ